MSGTSRCYDEEKRGTHVKTIQELVESNVSLVSIQVDGFKARGPVRELRADECLSFLVVAELKSEGRRVPGFV